MSHKNSMHLSIVTSFLAGAKSKDIDTDEILRKLNINTQEINNPNFRLPSNKSGALLKEVIKVLGDETCGFLERPTKIGAIELCLNSAIGSRNLYEFIHRVQNFFALIHDDFCLDIQIYGDDVKIAPTYLNPNRVEHSTFSLLALHFIFRVFSWSIDQTIRLSRVGFHYKESINADDYEDVFSCKRHFNQSTDYLVFNKKYLDYPIAQNAEDIPKFLKIAPNLVCEKPIENTFTNEIKRLLMDSDCVNALPMKSIAQTMNISEDTVRRKLRQEGNSYAEIKEGVRRELAIFQLHQEEYSISKIAHLVGFSETSAFSRAFKSWTGITPLEYRKSIC